MYLWSVARSLFLLHISRKPFLESWPMFPSTLVSPTPQATVAHPHQPGQAHSPNSPPNPDTTASFVQHLSPVSISVRLSRFSTLDHCNFPPSVVSHFRILPFVVGGSFSIDRLILSAQSGHCRSTALSTAPSSLPPTPLALSHTHRNNRLRTILPRLPTWGCFSPLLVDSENKDLQRTASSVMATHRG